MRASKVIFVNSKCNTASNTLEEQQTSGNLVQSNAESENRTITKSDTSNKKNIKGLSERSNFL